MHIGAQQLLARVRKKSFDVEPPVRQYEGADDFCHLVNLVECAQVHEKLHEPRMGGVL